MKMYLGDIYTDFCQPGRTSGNHAFRCGTDAKGLPIGMQLIGDCFQEKKLIQAAYTYEHDREKMYHARTRQKQPGKEGSKMVKAV